MAKTLGEIERLIPHKCECGCGVAHSPCEQCLRCNVATWREQAAARVREWRKQAKASPVQCGWANVCADALAKLLGAEG